MIDEDGVGLGVYALVGALACIIGMGVIALAFGAAQFLLERGAWAG